ncbi:mandelate racemase [Chitinophaga silvatica]|uniref:Mandelate racemase n=1 Tax=Chitinophaga silvatica TaxID=2282649 RepID=A0A3E1YD95_9BACT|nr:enolase C-terminal domain-like protein [Chitinophaga silvatica]RFS24478.1 mandelate racemase [Chitinophaga silvatica]
MIKNIIVKDARFPLKGGAGSDAVHQNPIYSYTVACLYDDKGNCGTGLAFTLGAGNELVCAAARFYGEKLIGKDLTEIMASFGDWFRQRSDEQQFRWLGPHKGVVHLALAAVTNACYDLWAKQQQVPLWKLLLNLSPEQLVNTLDLSYLEEVLSRKEAIDMLAEASDSRNTREQILQNGYPAYDTSAGWFNYPDEQLEANCKQALEKGFRALKLKVGSRNPDTDIRRANIVRNVVGPDIKVMVDANQQWNLPQAISIGKRLADINPYWIEEPTHPDDVLSHKILADALAPLKLAVGEHVPNKVIFKNYLQTGCAGFIQVDAVRVGGVSEFITVSLLCKKFGVPVVPHVGDMGQLHQHLVLFNHIGMGHEALFLEHIPHLREYFVNPASIVDGHYQTPQEPGSSCDLLSINSFAG